MPSSISSSDRPGFVRRTASDRPGVAQPVPERDIPALPWQSVLIIALLIFAMLLGAWEWQWRAYGARPSSRNSEGLWATQRRRIDDGEGQRTVILGASRMLFDIDLDTWERLSGERPIQLALEGTTPLLMLDDLVKDPKFNGRLLIGVAPDVFFSGFAFRGKFLKFFHKESPSERVGQWLSMHLVEPLFAFYDPDFALPTVVNRQDWPRRNGLERGTRVRKLSVSEADRNTRMWSKVENDAEYRTMAQRIWAEGFTPLDAAEQVELDKNIHKQIDRAAAAVAQLRARGIHVTFVRPPSGGGYLDYENRDFSRDKTWDPLLAATGVTGIHFQDDPELQGYRLPEWSHLAASEKPRFTEALYQVIERVDPEGEWDCQPKH